MAKKEKKEKEWKRIPVKLLNSQGDLENQSDKAKKVRGEYEEKLAVDISFEDLIKLSARDVEKGKSK
jgi:hypothetical protein